MRPFQYASVDDIPLWGGATEEGDVSDTESVCSDTDFSCASVSEGDTDSDTGSDRSPRTSLSPTSSPNKLMAFMNSMPSGAGAGRWVVVGICQVVVAYGRVLSSLNVLF
jgi:hypothetical protein